MASRKTQKRKRATRRTATEMMGRKPNGNTVSEALPSEPSVEVPARPPWVVPAFCGLVLAAIGAGVAAGQSRSPKDGVAVAVGVLVIGTLFGFLLRPPPLRDQPGDDTAIDFGRSEPRERQPTSGPSRAERRRQARDARRQ